MKLYQLNSTVAARGDLFDLSDPKSRVSDFFIRDTGSDKSFRFSKPSARAQSRIKLSDVIESDYLHAVIPVPIFSERARAALADALSHELRFYECVVECQGRELGFFLGKTLLSLPLIDIERSTYRTLTDGSQIVSKAAYLTSFEQEFFIARDVEYPSDLMVSQRFVDLCRGAALNIDFSEPV